MALLSSGNSQFSSPLPLCQGSAQRLPQEYHHLPINTITFVSYSKLKEKKSGMWDVGKHQHYKIARVNKSEWMRIIWGFKEKRIKGNVQKGREKWLPCETPNWSRNTSILNAQLCVSQYVLTKPAELEFSPLWCMQEDGLGTGRCSQNSGASSSLARQRRRHEGCSVPCPWPKRAALSWHTPARVVRAAGSSSRQQRRLETEAAVVKSTCSISRLHRAT